MNFYWEQSELHPTCSLCWCVCMSFTKPPNMAVIGFSLSLRTRRIITYANINIWSLGLLTLSVCLPLETKTCVRTSEELKQRQLKQRCHEINTEDVDSSAIYGRRLRNLHVLPFRPSGSENEIAAGLWIYATYLSCGGTRTVSALFMVSFLAAMTEIFKRLEKINEIFISSGVQSSYFLFSLTVCCKCG